jgi:GNAT superfamily N-acetyltransferase
MADNGAPALIVETEPDLGSLHLLEERLYEFNVQTTGIADGKLLSIFLRDPDGTVIGGTHGWTWAGRCYVRLLYIPASLRNQRYGTRLMQAVEQEARARDCHEMVLHTQDFPGACVLPEARVQGKRNRRISPRPSILQNGQGAPTCRSHRGQRHDLKHQGRGSR